jgi:hypothetical protein
VEVVLLGRRATMRHRALFGSDPFARAHSLLNHFPITKRAKSEMEASIHRVQRLLWSHTHITSYLLDHQSLTMFLVVGERQKESITRHLSPTIKKRVRVIHKAQGSCRHKYQKEDQNDDSKAFTHILCTIRISSCGSE